MPNPNSLSLIVSEISALIRTDSEILAFIRTDRQMVRSGKINTYLILIKYISFFI